MNQKERERVLGSRGNGRHPNLNRGKVRSGTQKRAQCLVQSSRLASAQRSKSGFRRDTRGQEIVQGYDTCLPCSQPEFVPRHHIWSSCVLLGVTPEHRVSTEP